MVKMSPKRPDERVEVPVSWVNKAAFALPAKDSVIAESACSGANAGRGVSSAPITAALQLSKSARTIDGSGQKGAPVGLG